MPQRALPDGTVEADPAEVEALQRALLERSRSPSVRDYMTGTDRAKRLQRQIQHGRDTGVRSMAQLSPHKVDYSRTKLGDLAMLYLRSGGDWLSAVEHAKSLERGDLELIARGAVNAGKLEDSPLVESMIATLAADLAVYSVFDRVLQSALSIDWHTRTMPMIASGAQAHVVGQAAPKPLSRVDFTEGVLVPIKIVATLVVSKEFLSLGFEQGAARLNDELVKAVGAETDRALFGEIVTMATVAGVSDGDILADVRTLLGSINRHAGARLLLAAPPTIVDRINTDASIVAAGGWPAAWPPLLASDGLEIGTDGGPLVLLDASQLAGASGPVDLRSATHTSVQMMDTPTPGAQQLVSLWQNNLVGLLCEREFIVTARPGAVAALEQVDYGST